MERTTVEAFGGLTISAFQLRQEIDAAGQDLDQRLKKMRR